jgi:hypothetical protein
MVIGWASLLALALGACGGGSAERRLAIETQREQNLVGTWDATLSLTRPYQLGVHEPATKRICGTIGFVENHHTKAASQTDDSTHLGVYDLDLSLLGLDWLKDTSFPAAVGTSVDDLNALARVASDSVSIVLNPGSQERIVLLGRYRVDVIRGHWTAQSVRGTASGSFILTPHVEAHDQSLLCSDPYSRLSSSSTNSEVPVGAFAVAPPG